MYVTFADLMDHALAYLGGDAARANSDRARRAVLSAYQDLPTRHPWHHYKRIGRITTVASYSTGTIEYDHTGGSSELLVTLTDGTWPTWAASGVLVIANVPYEVSERLDSTTLTLESLTNPGADVASGTSYTLYQDTYSLPSDLLTLYELTMDAVGDRVAYRPATEWAQVRRRDWGPGKPEFFCVTGDGTASGTLVVHFAPAPDAVYPVDFLYKRLARALAIDRKDAGTVSITSASATVTGVNTAFTSAMEGSVLRLSSDAKTAPTGNDGDNRAQFEGVIDSVASSTSLTLTAAAGQTLSGVKYVVSDPVDIDQAVHSRLLYRLIERQCRIVARVKENREDEREFLRALEEARAADARYAGLRVAAGDWSRPVRLADYPISEFD